MTRLLTRPIARLLDAVQRRFRRARPGSVLIMVVSLLVLLALIGTAAMSTARVDREASRQHVVNVQIEMLADGVKQLLIAAIQRDLYAPPYGSLTDSPGTDPLDTNPSPYDAFLGSPTPERLVNTSFTLGAGGVPQSNPAAPSDPANPVPGGSAPVVWQNISYPPLQSGKVWPMDLPYVPTSGAANTFGLTLGKRPWAVSAIKIGTAYYPALQEVNPDTGALIGSPMIAADTDYDGIADALYFKLPVSPINGVTWYGATRVLDHNSKLNVNTAGDPDAETLTGPGGTASIAGWFPSSVALYWSGSTPALLPLLDRSKSFGADGDPTKSSSPSYSEQERLDGRRYYGDPNDKTALDVKWSDAPNGRTDFVFVTKGDLLWHQLGRQLEAPGAVGAIKVPNLPGQPIPLIFGKGSRPFSVSDSIALSRGYVRFDETSKDSTVEDVLKLSTVWFAPSLPYAADQYNAWFNDNFGNVNGARNARPYLTGYNPVRNYVRRPVGSTGFPTKTNINTATFAELYQTFLDVMVDPLTPNSTPFDDFKAWNDTTFSSDPYEGQKFTQGSFGPTYNDHPARQFRSPIRLSGGTPGTRMHPAQVMAMRARLAALNAMTLRGGDRDIDQPLVGQFNIGKVPGVTDTVEFSVTLAAVGRQPYLTEIYLNNNTNKYAPATAPGDPPADPSKKVQNKTGFVAIELHNPYDKPLKLDGYHLRVIDRKTNPTGGFKLQSLADAATTPPSDPALYDLPASLEIPAYGFLIIHNFDEALDAGPEYAQYLPAQLNAEKAKFTTDDLATHKQVKLKGLSNLFDKELVITRDLLNAKDIPVDSFDASGFKRNDPPADDASFVTPVDAWYYNRANNHAASPRPWSFVYPGRYDGSQPDRQPRQQGTHVTSWKPDLPPPDDREPWETAPVAGAGMTFGKNDDLASREKAPGSPGLSTFIIPMFTPGMPGPFKAGSGGVGGKAAFPFGGFARLGDVMHVPYIGSYKVSLAGATDTFVEVNAVTMDAVFAEDTDQYDDKFGATPGKFPEEVGVFPEDVGRFAPLPLEVKLRPATGVIAKDTGTTVTDGGRTETKVDYFAGFDCVVLNADGTKQSRKVINSKVGEFTLETPFSPSVPDNTPYRLEYVRYGWSSDLFDYFTTIAAPADDYLPSADPFLYTPKPLSVKNVTDSRKPNREGLSATPVTPTEDDVPIEGLININTANWRVLASLPLVINDAGTVNPDESAKVARAIAYFRDVDCGTGKPWGPFKSILELNLVPGFAYGGKLGTTPIPFDVAAGTDPTSAQGDISPLSVGTSPHDGLRMNYEEKYLALTRISNLITLRSDTYTAYLIVEGWRNAGTPSASLVAKRRLSFIVDRSKMSMTKAGSPRTPAVHTVPTPQ
ncbi:MAG TPA: hypothetical protein VK986_11010 [Tepidisphaeraceae bacterium]|nr:hypothetical protein [Tepidisphaeraceae bacterium]